MTHPNLAMAMTRFCPIMETGFLEVFKEGWDSLDLESEGPEYGSLEGSADFPAHSVINSIESFDSFDGGAFRFKGDEICSRTDAFELRKK